MKITSRLNIGWVLVDVYQNLSTTETQSKVTPSSAVAQVSEISVCSLGQVWDKHPWSTLIGKALILQCG